MKSQYVTSGFPTNKHPHIATRSAALAVAWIAFVVWVLVVLVPIGALVIPLPVETAAKIVRTSEPPR